jgi:ribosomal protein L11 methyltransferase
MQPDLWQLVIHCPLADADALSDAVGEMALGVTIDVDSDAAIVTGIFAAPLAEDATARIAGGYKNHWQPLVQRDWLAAGARASGAGRVGDFTLVGSPSPVTRIISSRELYVESLHAFGDGYHATTQGCLRALGYVRRHTSAQRIADVGCGTGVLALAARKLWPQARIIATDIDAVAVATTRRNRQHNAANTVYVGRGAGLALRQHQSAMPYDVVVANILATPLARMAATVKKALKQGGYVVLSGLLEAQTPFIVSAYGRQRLHVRRRYVNNGWVTLVLQ